MLILRRNPGESVMIAQDIFVKVLKDASGAIHLGIEAPKHVKIIRTELLKKEALEASAEAILAKKVSYG